MTGALLAGRQRIYVIPARIDGMNIRTAEG